MTDRVDHTHHKVHVTDPDEPRFPAFYFGCAIACVLGLIAWASLVVLVRWALEERY